jgi:hypothetical protein
MSLLQESSAPICAHSNTRYIEQNKSRNLFVLAINTRTISKCIFVKNIFGKYSA